MMVSGLNSHCGWAELELWVGGGWAESELWVGGVRVVGGARVVGGWS